MLTSIIYILVSIICINLVIGTIFYFIMSDKDLTNLPKNGIERWWMCVYFSSVMFGTVSYGDIVPVSHFSRGVVSVYVLLIASGALTIIAELTSIIIKNKIIQ